MKLAIAHPFLHTKGGAERVVLKLAQHFGATVFCTEYDAEKTYPEFKNVDVRVLPRGWLSPFLGLVPRRARDAAIAGQQFWDWKAPDEFDVVNAHGTPSEWVRHKNAPVIFYCHNPNREAFILYEWRQRQRNALQRALYASFVKAYKHFEFQTVPQIEHIFCNSRTTRERIRMYLDREAEVLYPGVDYHEFECKGYERFFFYPSRIVPEKRFELAIEAFQKFKRMRKGKKREKWKLVIAGALHRGNFQHVEYYNKLHALAASDHDVELYLDLPFAKIRDLYARCYSVLYTPIHEDFGLVPVEGFAAKKPVLAWNEGGPREVVKHGENGFLVENTDELAAKMSWLADRPKLAEQMGKAGRKRAEKEFSWEHFLKRFGEVCSDLSKNGKNKQ